MSVNIEVSYRAPPDFDLSPPYYRPASSVTLSCVATGASDSVHIQWGSPHSGSFTNSNSRISPNSIRSSRDRLTVHDSGIHTCTITDADGTSLSTSVHVKLYGRLISSSLCKSKVALFPASGVGLYVYDTRGNTGYSTANNTGLSWRNGYRISVYCYSNSTLDSATIVAPDDIEYASYTSSQFNIHQQHPAGIRMQTHTRSIPRFGIYTCRMNSSTGHLREMSFGIYQTSVGECNIASCAIHKHSMIDVAMS